MKCNLYSITKTSQELEGIMKHYQKQCKSFGMELNIIDLMNNDILQAQKSSQKDAQESYTKAFLPFVKSGANIALHPNGKLLDSHKFSDFFRNFTQINFFIGGAYGFNDSFLQKCTSISLSPLTFSHKIAKIILCEQIYRGLSIINHHPYHK